MQFRIVSRKKIHCQIRIVRESFFVKTFLKSKKVSGSKLQKNDDLEIALHQWNERVRP